MDHSDFFESDQSICDHLIETQQKRFDLFKAVDDLYCRRQVFRKAKDLSRVQDTVFAETHYPAKHRRASKSCFTGLQRNHFVKRLVPDFVAFADEDSKQVTFFRNRHAITLAKVYPN